MDIEKLKKAMVAVNINNNSTDSQNRECLTPLDCSWNCNLLGACSSGCSDSKCAISCAQTSCMEACTIHCTNGNCLNGCSAGCYTAMSQ